MVSELKDFSDGNLISGCDSIEVDHLFSIREYLPTGAFHQMESRLLTLLFCYNRSVCHQAEQPLTSLSKDLLYMYPPLLHLSLALNKVVREAAQAVAILLWRPLQFGRKHRPSKFYSDGLEVQKEAQAIAILPWWPSKSSAGPTAPSGSASVTTRMGQTSWSRSVSYPDTWNLCLAASRLFRDLSSSEEF